MSFLRESITAVGLGIHESQIPELLASKKRPNWCEVRTEEYLQGGVPLLRLKQLREVCPIVLSGLNLSLGSVDSFDLAHLNALKQLIETIQPAWLSDKLSWRSVEGEYIPIDLPLPRTAEIAQYVAQRIRKIQTFFGRRILLENLPLYGNVMGSQLNDSQFMSEIAEQADCYLLIDIHHLCITANCLSMTIDDALQRFMPERVRQLRLQNPAGDIAPSILWSVYQKALHCLREQPSCIASGKAHIALSKLWTDAQKAQEILNAACVVA